ncbi:MAG: hypothetical protein WC187_08940 [Bacillota bacterium]
MILKTNSMLEVSELIFALLERQKLVNEVYTWEKANDPNSTKYAIQSLINQVKTAHPFMFPSENENKTE